MFNNLCTISNIVYGACNVQRGLREEAKVVAKRKKSFPCSAPFSNIRAPNHEIEIPPGATGGTCLRASTRTISA